MYRSVFIVEKENSFAPENVKIIITGAKHVGKTTFIHTISEIPLITPEHDPAPLYTIAMDFGRITIEENLLLYLIGTPEGRRYDFIWEIMAAGMIGFVILVDSCDTSTFRESKSILDIFEAHSPFPSIVAANKQDLPGAWSVQDLRIALRIPGETPVLPCIATDKESVKAVLLALCQEALLTFPPPYQ